VQVFPHGGNEPSPRSVALHGKGETPDSFARLDPQTRGVLKQ
jgi:hypothetical protein